MNEPEYHTVLDKFNLTPLYLGSEECEKAVREEIEPMGRLVKKLGLDKK